MKNKFLLPIVLLSLTAVVVLPAAAAENPPTRAEIANRVTAVNRITDYFATLGKTGTQSAAILDERKKARREERLRDLQQRQPKAVRREQKERQRINKQLKKNAADHR